LNEYNPIGMIVKFSNRTDDVTHHVIALIWHIRCL